MHGDQHRHRHRERDRHYERIALIGNPNVGKSVIFGLLTGKYVTVSNYPGTTVEVSYGDIALDGKKCIAVDTPGVNSLIPMSEDERVTRDIFLKERPSLVIQVADSKNLNRTILLTLQIPEMGLPMVLDLNMEDEARERGLIIDIQKLKGILKTEIVTTIAPQRKGLRELKDSIISPSVPSVHIEYAPVIEEYIEKISLLLPEGNISKRSVAVMILSGDESLKEWLTGHLSIESIKEIESLRDECQLKMHGELNSTINRARLDMASEIASRVIKYIPSEGGRLFSFIGKVSMHPVWGIPVLLLVLFGLYEFVGVFGGGTLVNFFERTIFGEYINPMATKVVKLIIPIGFVQELLVANTG